MHVVIPFALSDDPACRQAAKALQLPHLSQMVQALSPSAGLAFPPNSLALVHEHLQAAELGWPMSSSYPWAALKAAQQGLDRSLAWAFVTPCHWQVGQGQVMMSHPQALGLQAQEMDELRLAMQDFFAEDGITLHAAPGQSHWLASGEVFRHLPTAPVARAVGRHLSPWLPPSDLLRRLQNEMQMLFYTHPLHDARSARGELAVNSVWFSGSGALPQGYTNNKLLDLQALSDLETAALNNDWAAWQRSWATLDATLLPQVLQAAAAGPVRLSLCSEDKVLTLSNTPRNFLQKLKHRLSPQGLNTVWNAL